MGTATKSGWTWTRSHLTVGECVKICGFITVSVVVEGSRGGKREERASLLQNAAMDSWDDADWDKKEEVNDKIEQWRNSNAQVCFFSLKQLEITCKA